WPSRRRGSGLVLRSVSAPLRSYADQLPYLVEDLRRFLCAFCELFFPKLLGPNFDYLAHAGEDHVFVDPHAIAKLRRQADAPDLVELTLLRHRHVEPPEADDAPIVARQVRDLALVLLPAAERIEVQARIARVGRAHVAAVALGDEHVRKAGREAGAALVVDAVGELTAEHVPAIVWENSTLHSVVIHFLPRDGCRIRGRSASVNCSAKTEKLGSDADLQVPFGPTRRAARRLDTHPGWGGRFPPSPVRGRKWEDRETRRRDPASGGRVARQPRIAWRAAGRRAGGAERGARLS